MQTGAIVARVRDWVPSWASLMSWPWHYLFSVDAQ